MGNGILDKVFRDHFVKGLNCECSPTRCECGGLIHSTGGTMKPVSYDPIYYTIWRCDTCGKEGDNSSVKELEYYGRL